MISLDNENNKIEYGNTLKSITNEYHQYNEYNNSKYQNKNYYERPSIKEYNANKASVSKLSTKPKLISKLFSSFLVVTIAVVMGTGFIIGPVSKVSEVYIDSYENSLFISVMFEEYSQDDNLELVVKNDFTNRIFQVEAREEGYEEDKMYMYFTDVHDLKANCTYQISIISGINTLYSQSYNYKIVEKQAQTKVTNMDLYYYDELINVFIEFDSFSNDDYILLELEKDNIIYESIVISEARYENEMYIYDNSFSVYDEGEYKVNIYINSEAIISKYIDVSSQSSVISNVDYLEYDYYGDNILYYYICFSEYNSNEEIYLKIYSNSELISSLYLDDIRFDNDSYVASGEIEAYEGNVTIVVEANNTVIYEDNAYLELQSYTTVSDISVENNDYNVTVYVYFSEYNDSDDIKLVISKDYQDIFNETINGSIIGYTNGYQYSNEIIVDSYGEIQIDVLANNDVIYSVTKDINMTNANSIISNVDGYLYEDKAVFVIDFYEYDNNESISLKLGDNNNVNIDVITSLDNDGLSYAYIEDYYNDNPEYAIYVNDVVKIYEGVVVGSSLDVDISDVEINVDSVEEAPNVRGVLSQEVSELYLRFICLSKAIQIDFVDGIEYLDNLDLFYPFDGLEEGSYVLQIIAKDNGEVKLLYCSEFIVNGG